MGRDVKIPWVGGSIYNGYRGKNTMVRVVDTPWVGGGIPWVGGSIYHG